MTPGSDNYDLNDTASIGKFRKRLAELQKRAIGLSRIDRHDITNVLGAAKNAMALIEEGATGTDRERFLEIATRNLREAERLAQAPLADSAPAAESGRNERNDLGRAGERDNLDSTRF